MSSQLPRKAERCAAAVTSLTDMNRLVLACTLLSTFAVSAQESAQPVIGTGNQEPFVQATFEDFRLRAVGPAIASGRVGSIAVHPENKQTWYIGVVVGRRVEDHQRRHHLDAGLRERRLLLDRHRRDRPEESQHALGRHGRGQQPAHRRLRRRRLPQSTMPGKTWRNMGLKTSEHIGRIVIDPRDSNVVFVAA